jgi:hypothetical protein
MQDTEQTEGGGNGNIFTRRDRLTRLLTSWQVTSILVAFVLGSSLAKLSVAPHQLDGTEALANLDIGRAISSGEGFHTRAVTPLSLAYVAVRGDSAPDVENPPLFPLLMAMLLLPVRSLSPSTAIAFSILLHVLTAASVFFWSLRLSKDMRIACMAGLMYGLSPLALDAAASGTPHTLVSLIVTNLVFWTIAVLSPAQETGEEPAETPVRDRRHSWPSYLAGGALAGLATLADYRMALVAGIVLIALAARRQGPGILAFVGGAVLVVAPWAIRNMNVGGNPLFSLYWARAMVGTDSFPGLSLYCRGLTGQETLLGLAAQHRFEILTRAGHTLFQSICTLPGQIGPVFAALALIGYLGKAVPRGVVALTLAVVGAILLTTALWASSLLGVLAAMPLLAYVGGSAWAKIMDRLLPTPEPAPTEDEAVAAPPSRPRLHAIAFLVVALVATLNASPLRKAPQSSQAEIAALSKLLNGIGLPPHSRILTDIPWDLTCYTGKVTCAIPVSPDAVAELDKHLPCEVIVLSSAMGALTPSSYLSAWHWVGIKKEVLADYHLIHRSVAGMILLRPGSPADTGAGAQPTGG